MRARKGKARKRKRLFNQKNAKDDPNIGLAPEDSGDSSDDDDDMPPLMPADNWEPCLGAADQVTQVPSRAVCEMTGAMMCDPVMTPDGHVFERVALEDWMTVSASNPKTGQALSMEEITPALQIQEYIQAFQMQMISSCQIAPEAFEQPAQLEPQAAAPSRFLGDLPCLTPAAAPVPAPVKKEKAKIKITSRSVVDCPEDMRCAIDGKVCINPVRSCYGHLFEKKTLDKWFANVGSVCPVTSKPLRVEECQQDAEMKK